MSISATAGLAVFGARRAAHERFAIAVPVVTYALLVAVFASIFHATPLHELPKGLRVDAAGLIWYLVLTEMTTFIGGYTFSEVRSDVLDGQFTASLQRPVSYMQVKLAEWAGQRMVRASAFMTAGFVLGWLFTGTMPFSLPMLPFFAVSVLLGAAIHSTIYGILGVFEVWGPYARPAMWISQKFCFLLGGLLLPLSLYPHWLQAAAWVTPYPAILYVSGRLALDPDGWTVAAGFAAQGFWLAVTTALAFAVQRAAARTIMRRGF